MKDYIQRYKKWKRPLDILEIPYTEDQFRDNFEDISLTCTTKMKPEFFKDRYFMFMSNEECQKHAEDFKAEMKTKRNSPYDVKHVMKRDNVSKEEAEGIVKKLKETTCGTYDNFIARHGVAEGARRFAEFRDKSMSTEENFIKRYGEQEGRERWKIFMESRDTSSLESFIRRYGEDEGTSRHEKYLERISKALRLEGYIEKHGEEEGKRLYEAACDARRVDLERTIERYGEEDGRARYEAMRRKKSYANSLEWYVERYGEDEGTDKYEYRKMVQSPMFNSLKAEFGYDKAVEKFKEYQGLKSKKEKRDFYKGEDFNANREKSQYQKYSSGSCSRESTLFFLQLEENLGRSIRREGNGGEYKLFDAENFRSFHYDGFDEETGTIIEYHGVAYHPKEGDVGWTNPFGQGYEEIREKDVAKRALAVDKGYDFIVVWSDECNALYRRDRKAAEVAEHILTKENHQ